MKIIKSGITAQPWVSTEECHHCNAVLDVELSDLTKRKRREYDRQCPGGYTVTDVGFSCPECGTFVVVKDLHHALRSKIKEPKATRGADRQIFWNGDK